MFLNFSKWLAETSPKYYCEEIQGEKTLRTGAETLIVYRLRSPDSTYVLISRVTRRDWRRIEDESASEKTESKSDLQRAPARTGSARVRTTQRIQLQPLVQSFLLSERGVYRGGMLRGHPTTLAKTKECGSFKVLVLLGWVISNFLFRKQDLFLSIYFHIKYFTMKSPERIWDWGTANWAAVQLS